jgi:hypothetical protein
MRLTALAAAALGSAAVLVGFAGAASASATVDLIWIDKTDTTCTNDGRRDCPRLGTALSSVAVSDNIALAVILTAGPGGSMGAGVSVNYNELLPMMSVSGFQSLTTTVPSTYLLFHLGNTTNQSPYIDNINAASLPAGGLGLGLPASQSAYLGTVTFHKDMIVNGTFEIPVGTDGPGGTDGVLDRVGNNITATTTFNSAFLVTTGVPGDFCSDAERNWMIIEVNALRAAGKTVATGPNQTVNVTAKARILKGTAVPDTTIDTTLTIEAVTPPGGTVIGTNSTGPIKLAVGKGGKGAKLALDTPQCVGGYIEFVATFSGTDQDGDVCTGTRALRKQCR